MKTYYNVEITFLNGKLGMASRIKKGSFTLTEINVSKRTTPYLSPEPVLVSHSQLHDCRLSLLQTDNTDMVRRRRTYDTSLSVLCFNYLTTISETLKDKILYNATEHNRGIFL